MNVIRASQMASLLAVLLAAGAARAQPVGFAFEQSIYQDSKEAPLKGPEGVACSDTALVVADSGNERLITFTLKDGRLSLGTEVKLTQPPTPPASSSTARAASSRSTARPGRSSGWTRRASTPGPSR